MLLKNKQTKKSFTPGVVLPAPCSVHSTNSLIPGVGVLPYISHLGMCPLPPPPPPKKGMVFAPFWSENGNTFCPFWSGIGYGLRGNYGSIRTYFVISVPNEYWERKLPRTQTSLFDVRAKEGGKETTGEACRLYPSHGPLRFITSHPRFALASAMRKTKRLRRRLERKSNILIWRGF